MRQLLSSARAQTEHAAADVQAAALLYLARVLTVLDPDEAQPLLDRGLALLSTLTPRHRDAMRGQAACLAAAVAPDRAVALFPTIPSPSDGVIDKALFDMLAHGHVETAVAYLTDPAHVEDYPFAAAHQAMTGTRDAATRVSLLRSQIRAMHHAVKSGSTAPSIHHPLGLRALLTHAADMLPAHEASAVAAEAIDWIRGVREQFVHATFSHGWQTVRFSSSHDHQLFQILMPLRRLVPARLDELLRDHAELAAAAAIFPSGMEYPQRAATTAAAMPPAEMPDYIQVGGRVMPIADAMGNDFEEAFALAARLYDRDRASTYPRECWPSAWEYRNVLFKAGQHQGRDAARHLSRIDDPALRLFAQIELVAAMVGLPQMGGRTMTSLAKGGWSRA